ncbi:MAG: N-acetylmuramic acid 6-phosphate etherase [Cyclobacteriaceae bacterium]
MKEDEQFQNVTESASRHQNLEKMSVSELVEAINSEDKSVAEAVGQSLQQITSLIEAASQKMASGGRLFYIGAGTSGRLGILDASEIPPTFGMPHDRVIGLIAGGDGAIRKAVEFAEDDAQQVWKDLSVHDINDHDFLVGIAASGRTPYVIGGLKAAKSKGILTGCITCNSGSKLAETADYPIEVIVGPEFVTGSTRMKAGTAQKMVLNMISTSLMIKIGRVSGNKMTYMQLSNDKLIERGVKMIMEALHTDEETAKELLQKHGSVNSVLTKY